MVSRIAFCSGELSGDEHLSEVIKSIRLQSPQIEFRGLAGPKTRALGINTELALEDYAGVMGFVDVLRSAPKIFSALAWFKNLFKNWKPDILVIVDYPDFNLKLAKHAKANGIKVIYFIPPKIWIWRSSRIKLIEQYVDQVALIFPFEKPFYESLGFKKATYVGHPFHNLLKKDDSDQGRADFYCELGLSSSFPTLAFFPGSRPSEIRRHWPGMVAGIEELRKRVPNLQVLLSMASPVKDLLSSFMEEFPLDCRIIEGRNLDILKYSNVGFIKSGTSNLQAAFFELPFVMYYQAGIVAEIIVKSVIKIKEYSLVNIILPGTAVELTQKAATPERIADELKALLDGTKPEIISNLRKVKELLGEHDRLEIFEGTQTPYERVARLALAL